MKFYPIPVSLTLATLIFTSSNAFATPPSQFGARGLSGTLACGGNHFMRDGGRELHTTTYSLRNYASAGTVMIDSVTLYDANGDVIFDSESSGFPGPRTELGPHQSVLFNTGAILAFDLPSDLRPIQAIVRWSASQKAPDLKLSGSTTRLARTDTGQERSRSDSECVTLDKGRRWGH